MSFFVGKRAAVVIYSEDSNVAQIGNMTEWTLSVDGERVDISDYDSRTYRGVVGMRTATVTMRGPYPTRTDVIGLGNSVGYSIMPGHIIRVFLYLDETETICPPYQLQVLIDKMDLTTDVKGVVQCTISAVCIGNFTDATSTDMNTEPFMF
jgi:hypothetical protein